MSDDLLPLELPATPRKRRGPAAAAVEATLKAWRAAGHLVGPEHAARRRVLRDSADAVDAAAATMHGAPRCPTCRTVVTTAYSGSPGALAYANNIHAGLLSQLHPDGAAGPVDPYSGESDDDDLAAAVAAALGGQPDTALVDASSGHDD